MIRNAVLHINNEQPLLADLYAMPSPSDVAVLCTNLRMLNGKRPIFADDSASVFLFPLVHLRFIEILPSSTAERPELAAETRPAGPPAVDDESELEIDEDFLRRVRDA
jgi:hypothetical protein